MCTLPPTNRRSWPTQEDGRKITVTVTGQCGVGKTRLIDAIISLLDSYEIGRTFKSRKVRVDFIERQTS